MNDEDLRKVVSEGVGGACIIRIRVLGSSGEMGEGNVTVRPPPETGAHVHRIQPGGRT
jgi:hypothetical protein